MTRQPSEATDEVARLADNQYVSLTTFRRDGTPVSSPVWVSSDGSRLYVWTRANAGKVKRIGHTPEVTVAPCDGRGRVSGESTGGRARVLDSLDTARVVELHRAKYRRQFWIFGLLGKLMSRRTGGEVGIAVELD
jgi:uncharacterized protein